MTPASLKAWRARHKLSRRAAAEQLGCGERSIRNWEGGVNPIPRYIALACAAISNGLPPMP